MAGESIALEDAQPELMITLETNRDESIAAAGNNNSNFIGNTITLTGTINDFKLYFDSHPGNDWTTSYDVRYVCWQIVKEELKGYHYNNTGINVLSGAGEDSQISLSPTALNRFILDGNHIAPVELEMNWEGTDKIETGNFTHAIDIASKGSTYFRYAGRIFMSTPVIEKQQDNTYTYKLHLYNISDGLENAVKIGETTADITDITAITYMNGAGTVDNEHIDMYLLADNRIIKYTTRGTEQPDSPARIYAYNLKAEHNDSTGYDISFELNEDARSVEVILSDFNTGVEIKAFELGTFQKGNNYAEIADSIIPETGRYSWSIRATADNVTRFIKLSDDSEKWLYAGPKSITVDNSPESDYFGRIYISNSAEGEKGGRNTTKGIYVLDADGTDITAQGNTAYAGGLSWTGTNGTNFRKVAVAPDGRIFIADASNAESGIYIMDPAAFTMSPLFTGERNAEGKIMNNGTYVGGITSAVGLREINGNTQLYTIDLSHPNGSAWKGMTNTYNIGAANTWTTSPSTSAASSSYVGNENNSVVPVSTGYWAGQYRGAGSNSAGTPSVYYYSDEYGDAVFNSFAFTEPNGNVIEMNQSSQNGGLAVHERDGLVALSYDGGVQILQYTLDKDGLPEVYAKFHNSLGTSGVTYDDFAYDYAGNLYAVSYSGGIVSKWAMPTHENSCTTPAPSSLFLVYGGVEFPTIKDPAYELDYDKLTLTWSAPEAGEMEVKEYNIYKDDKLTGTTTETNFTEEWLNNGTYIYDITAVYTDDRESPKVSITVKLELQVANIYASGLSMTSEEVGYNFDFLLNENAREVLIEFTDGTEVLGSYNAGALDKGQNSIFVSNKDIPSDENMRWQVKASAPGIINPIKISDETQAQMQFWGPRGLAVDNNPESPWFGRIYVSETQGGTVSNRTTNNGIYILDPMFTDITGQGATAYTGGHNWHTSSSPFRICVASDGCVFMSDWSDTHSGVYVMDPANPAGEFTAVFGGERDIESGLLTHNGVIIGGSSPHCWVLGEGEETKLYVFDEDYTDIANGVTKGNNLLQYNIGLMESPWVEAPTAVVYNDAANGGRQLNGNSSIAPDGRGGWWISQYRATDAADVPSLIHVNTSGTIDFNSGLTPALIGGSNTGGMAVSPDFSKLAIGAQQNTLKIYEITFDESNVPALTLLHTISTPGAYTAGLAFDIADNVYLVSNSNERLSAWSLPKEENVCTTPAPSSQLINNTAPPVTGLKAEVDFNEITLSWSAPENEEDNIQEYNVYRDDVWVSNTTLTTFVDSDMDNGTYIYDVTVVYKDGTESAKTSVTAVVNMFAGPVRNLTADVNGNEISLSWEAPEGIRAIPKYNIYRDEDLIANVEETTYVDTPLQAKTYLYSVTAVYGNYETGKATVSATITTGLDNITNLTIVYPNPTYGNITVESGTLITEIRVIDLSGRLLMNITGLNSYKETINIADFDTGIYILKVNGKDMKVVKQ